MNENLTLIYQSLPYLLKGCTITIGLVGGALGLGFVIGVPMAVGQVYGNKYLSGLISLYVWFFRGLPVLVLLHLFKFHFSSLHNQEFSLYFPKYQEFSLHHKLK